MTAPVRKYRPNKIKLCDLWGCWVLKPGYGWYWCSTDHRTRADAVKHCAELNAKAIGGGTLSEPVRKFRPHKAKLQDLWGCWVLNPGFGWDWCCINHRTREDAAKHCKTLNERGNLPDPE